MLRKKRYSYVTQGKKGMEGYSGRFDSELEALNWYELHGKGLEKLLNVELVLTYTDEKRGK